MKVKIMASDLKRIVDGTKKFLSKNNYNKLMNHICLEVDITKGTIRATALDGHRVSVEYAKIVEGNESFTCYIKPNVPKISKKDIYAEIEVVGEKAYVTVGESITGYIQPQGTLLHSIKTLFEDLEKVSPIASIGVDAILLKEALESVDKQDKAYVKIDIRQPHQPIVITPTRQSKRDNVKIVLPVRLPSGE